MITADSFFKATFIFDAHTRTIRARLGTDTVEVGLDGSLWRDGLQFLAPSLARKKIIRKKFGEHRVHEGRAGSVVDECRQALCEWRRDAGVPVIDQRIAAAARNSALRGDGELCTVRGKLAGGELLSARSALGDLKSMWPEGCRLPAQQTLISSLERICADLVQEE